MVRAALPDEGEVVLDDLLRGRVAVRYDHLDDFILARPDGSPLGLSVSWSRRQRRAVPARLPAGENELAPGVVYDRNAGDIQITRAVIQQG